MRDILEVSSLLTTSFPPELALAAALVLREPVPRWILNQRQTAHAGWAASLENFDLGLMDNGLGWPADLRTFAGGQSALFWWGGVTRSRGQSPLWPPSANRGPMPLHSPSEVHVEASPPRSTQPGLGQSELRSP